MLRIRNLLDVTLSVKLSLCKPRWFPSGPRTPLHACHWPLPLALALAFALGGLGLDLGDLGLRRFYKKFFDYIDLGSGFRVPGSGFRVPGSGFRVPGSGFLKNFL